jgi:hypothetical protein
MSSRGSCSPTLLVPQGMAYAELADLPLCGHHYRASCAALAAADAVIINDRRSGGTIITEYERGDPLPSDATPRR